MEKLNEKLPVSNDNGTKVEKVEKVEKVVENVKESTQSPDKAPTQPATIVEETKVDTTSAVAPKADDIDVKSTVSTGPELKEVVEDQPVEKVVGTEDIMDLSEEKKKINGIGDVVKVITNAVGIKTCDECEERRKKLNKIFPFTRVVRDELTEEEIEFVGSIDKKITSEQRITLGNLYDKLFNTKTRHCNCPGIYKNMLERLRVQIDYQSIK